ncbi:MAG: efflux RND transporter periplasmic adaptor subunit [Phycisphaeraceae bacterium]|nr:efflux RND transporter periplasmic adaptor subunit [Phycisphaeraceae bacterium]
MIHKNPTCRSLSPILRPTGAILLALGLLTPMASCKKHQEGDGHDHGTPTAKDQHAEGDGHDHGAGEEHTDEVKLTGEAVERYGVKVGEAQMWALKPTFVAPARVGFNTEAMAHVGSPLRGRAVEIKVRLGDQVKKDDPLVVVESPELGQAQADFLLKRTAAQTAVPQVDLAKAAWDRAKGLLDQSQGISLTEVQKREAEYKAAVASVKAAEAAAVAAENGLHLLGMDQKAVEELAKSSEIMPRYTIRAAINGQVVQREITLGELVSPDRESVMVLADTSTLWVLADLPEARLPAVAVGAKAWVTVGSVGGQKFEGQVAFISPLVDPTTRTAQVRIELPSGALGGGAVRPGMFAQAEIVATTPDGADPAPQVAVPQEAVQTVEGGPAVFVPVAGEPNTFQKRALTIGPTVGGLVPVFAGLVEGEKFAIAGSFILKAELGKGSAAHEH